MRIAAVLAGFSMGQSDVLRKAMGKKDPKVMAKQREAFMTGARAKGVNEKKAAKIFDLMEFFAGYGFNKSHSTTYAWVAYQTAYLKANYPWHFMAALLTIEAANTDKLAMYLGECRDLGIPILPPDINSSELAFTVAPRRRPLRPVRHQERRRGRDPVDAGDPQGTRADRLAATRSASTPISGSSTSASLESLIKAGALDSLACEQHRGVRHRRARLFAAVDKAIEHGGRHQRDRDKGQSQLFGGFGDDDRRRNGAAARRAAVDRDAAAGLREGSARPLHERPSAGALRG